MQKGGLFMNTQKPARLEKQTKQYPNISKILKNPVVIFSILTVIFVILTLLFCKGTEANIYYYHMGGYYGYYC